MSEPTAYVYVDLKGTPYLAGRLWSRVKNGRESATFEYAASWLDFDERFALDPALHVGPGPHHTPEGRSIFSALGDSAPDRWGRELIARNERREAKREGRTPRTLWEADFLLAVSDVVRPGALRFSREEGGPFVAVEGRDHIPPLVRLPELLAASDRLAIDAETHDDIQLLLAHGSSLGGARPKASVLAVDGALSIAKFPAPGDPYDVVRWEAVALSLAAEAGIETPTWRLQDVAGRPVLLLDRFDRTGEFRIPFLSTMSMLGAADHETRSYMEIADVLRRHGAESRRDLGALWRRIVFNVLVSNTDDHLRNHGFLYTGTGGWRLAPAFDLNPVPVDLKPRVLSTAIGIDGDPSASLELAFEVAEYFGLDAAGARDTVGEVARSVGRWRHVAGAGGLSPGEIDRMSSAFEHEDLALARTRPAPVLRTRR